MGAPLWRRSAWAILVAAGVWMPTAAALAHPLSTTRVAIDAAADRFEVTIRMDADALIARLEAESEAPTSAPAAAASLEKAARIWALQSLLEHALALDADGRRVPLTLREVSLDEVGDAVVSVVGGRPPDVRVATWRMTLASAAYPLTVRAGSRETLQMVEGRGAAGPFALGASRAERPFLRSVVLGFTHILPRGLDHILFVAGLALLAARKDGRAHRLAGPPHAGARTGPWGRLVLLVSSFTVAHSLTLGLGLYGIVAPPAHVVEPLIALSVAYVGIENLTVSTQSRARVAVVFAFGLLHGLGFAGVLAGAAASPTAWLPTLIGFNAGVELGQLAVLLATCALVRAAAAFGEQSAASVTRTASAAVALTGIIWTIDRI
jgi:hypothetical protein